MLVQRLQRRGWSFAAIARSFPRDYQLAYSDDNKKQRGKKVISIINNHQKDAVASLKKAIAELSGGAGESVFQYSSPLMIKERDSMPLESLTRGQLEELGTHHYYGFGDVFEANPARAVEVWNAATKKGCVESACHMALCLKDGHGVERDEEAAFQMIVQLAENYKHGKSHYFAGLMLLDGVGTSVDEKQAVHHFKQAVGEGFVAAGYNIANCYAIGRGVEENIPLAFRFYEKCAEAGDVKAKHTLGTWLFQGRGIESADKERAFQFFTEAAAEGHPMATYNAACCFMSGEGLPDGKRNLKKAEALFKQAYKMNILEAGVNLGKMYKEGINKEDGSGAVIVRDLQKARKMFEHLSKVKYHDDSFKVLLYEIIAEIEEMEGPKR